MQSWLRWRSPERAASGRPPTAREAAATLGAEDLARAARLLVVRSSREATGLFAGSYTSAFRGGGAEFDESRPYVPGDDVRNLDWNALARTGEPFVKRFREERDELVLLALDVSASMGFGTTGRSKAAVAARAAGLVAAAAGRAGDRVGLLTFDRAVRDLVPLGRGAAHTWRVIRTAATAARPGTGGTDLAAGLEGLLAQAHHRAVAIALSDFRQPGPGPGAAAPLLDLARRHDLVAAILHDPREEQLPRAGLVRVRDPEAPHHQRVVDAGSARVRRRYAKAWAERAGALERSLRESGADVLWLRTDVDPFHSLLRFFERRAAAGGRAA